MDLRSDIALLGDEYLLLSAGGDTAPAKRVRSAYFRWMSGGLLGVHQFYLSRSFAGTLQLGLFAMAVLLLITPFGPARWLGLACLLGSFVWVVADGCRLPSMVRRANRPIAPGTTDPMAMRTRSRETALDTGLPLPGEVVRELRSLERAKKLWAAGGLMGLHRLYLGQGSGVVVCAGLILGGSYVFYVNQGSLTLVGFAFFAMLGLWWATEGAMLARNVAHYNYDVVRRYRKNLSQIVENR